MSDRLTTDQAMTNDTALISADGRFAAYLQSDANLVLCYTKNGAADLSRPYWSCGANAAGNYVNGGQRHGAPYEAVMQDDGNFVLYNVNPKSPYWASNTSRGKGQFTAIMQNDGNFVVYAGPSGATTGAVWASNTAWAGSQVVGGDHLATNQWLTNDSALVSANGKYAAYLQSDANLVLCLAANGVPDLGRPYWSVFAHPESGQTRSQPSGAPYHAIMQDDGNFVLYDGRDPGHSGPPYWASNTSRGKAQFTATMQNDGNFVLYSGTPAATTGAIWASHTVAGQGTGLAMHSGDGQSVFCQTPYGIPNQYYATFAPLQVTTTDSVLTPVAGKQVTWTIAPGSEMTLDYYVISTADGTGIRPADYADLATAGFHWTTTSDANGIASLPLQWMEIPIPGPAQGEGVECSVTAHYGGASVTFGMRVAGIML